MIKSAKKFLIMLKLNPPPLIAQNHNTPQFSKETIYNFAYILPEKLKTYTNSRRSYLFLFLLTGDRFFLSFVLFSSSAYFFVIGASIRIGQGTERLQPQEFFARSCRISENISSKIKCFTI